MNKYRRLGIIIILITIGIILVVRINQLKIGVIQELKNVDPLQNVDEIENFQVLDLVERRKQFINPIYKKWDPNNKLDMENHCNSYFSELGNLHNDPGSDIIDLEQIQSYEFDSTLYKEKLWMKKAARELRKQLRAEGNRYTEDHTKELTAKYNEELKFLANYENQVVQEFNHKRVFGKCFLNKNYLTSNQCSIFQKKLYPWLSRNYPSYQNWRLETGFPTNDKPDATPESDCFLQEFLTKSSGKGIVIPFIANDFKEEQLQQLYKLINILRSLKNDLPIQIMYMRDSLTKQDLKDIVKIARTIDIPKSLNNLLQESKKDFDIETDFPKQNIWFVDLTNVLNHQQHPLITKSYNFNSPTFIMTLSLIFNSFEDVIMLSTKTIPLLENFANKLFNSDNYKKYGQIFFKNPSHFKVQRRVSLPGFQETNDLIQKYFMPNKFDEFFFKINVQSNDQFTNLIFKESVSDIMDTNMIVINKAKHLSGLLIACNLQLYKLIEGRFQIVKDEIFQDSFWLGLHISGINNRVYFNRLFAGIPGILTPSEKKDFHKMTTSHELCSSSWCQIDENDEYTIIYMTTHQLENWVKEESFKNDLVERFKVEGVNNDDDVLQIENVIKPPELLKKVHVVEYREPSSGWRQLGDFAGHRGHPYWCGYDIIGGPKTNVRGIIYEYGKTLQQKFKLAVNIWLE